MKSVLTRHHELLRSLEAISNTSVPILSVYLNLGPHPDETRTIGARLRDQLRPIQAMAESDGLDHAAAMSLRLGIARVLELEPTLEAHRGHGWAIFVCDRLNLEEQLIVPSRVWDCAMAGSRPYLRPLRATLDEFRRVATVVFDARRAEVTVSYMGKVLDHRVFEAEIVRKANRGGWHGLDEHRNRQHAEEVRHRLWREIAESLVLLRRDMGIEVIFVGGQHKATEGLVGSLPPAIRALVIGTFTVDVHMLTEAHLMQIVGSLEEAHERREEERMVADTYAAAAADDLAAVGIDQVLRAVNQQAIAQLVIQHGAVIEGRVCPSCGAVYQWDQACAGCGTDTHAVPDVLEAIVHAVVAAGGVVEHVIADTALLNDIVAARLRVPLG